MKKISVFLLLIFPLFAQIKPLGILTCSGYDEYKRANRELLTLCFPAELVIWNKPHRAWQDYRAFVILSTWDYYQKGNLEPFLETLQKIQEAGVPLFNSLETVQWNCRKTYLQDLAKKGVAVPDTVWLSSSDLKNLPAILQEKGWTDAILKPLVSGGGFNTYRIKNEDITSIVQACEELSCDWLLQPFLTEIMTEGEWSFIFIDGQFSHALLKKPAPGQFLVQYFWGGTIATEEPEPWMIDEAARILAVSGQKTLHARVDVIRQNKTLFLLELELIEPLLYSELKKDVTALIAESIAKQERLLQE